MIDKDQNNEEYKLDDLDLLASDPTEMGSEVDRELEEDQKQSKESLKQKYNIPLSVSPFVKRLLIVFGGVIGLIISYQIMQSFLFDDQPSNKEMLSPIEPMTPKPTAIAPVITQTSTASHTESMSKKMSDLQQRQEASMSALAQTNQSLNALQNVVNDLSIKIAQTNDALVALSQKVEAQSHLIEQWAASRQKSTAAQQTTRVRTRTVASVGHEKIEYYLQAVIPGRAWLMNTNGGTLTVQMGSVLPGYGVVRRIDPEHGRVMTSSGRIIRFSQLDS